MPGAVPVPSQCLQTLPRRIFCPCRPLCQGPEPLFSDPVKSPQCLHLGSYSSGEVLVLARILPVGEVTAHSPSPCCAGPARPSGFPLALPSLSKATPPPHFYHVPSCCVKGRHDVLTVCRLLIAKFCYRDILLERPL